MHPIQVAYLQYYAAASYETLGRITHDFSSSKLPLLNMAKECFAACDVALVKASATFTKERDNLNISLPESDASPFDYVPSLSSMRRQAMHRGPSDDAPRRLGLPNQVLHGNTGFYSPNWTDICNEETHRGSPSERGFDDDSSGNDLSRLQMSAYAKMMPEPLCIRKSHTEVDPFLDSPLSKKSSRQSRPLSEALPVLSPFFSDRGIDQPYEELECRNIRYASTTVRPPPLMALTTAAPPKMTDVTAIRARQTYQSYTRALENITSLRSQVAANIEAITAYSNTTIELQRIHKATKDKRLASFWSFQPATQTSQQRRSSANTSGNSNNTTPNGSSSSRRSSGSGSRTERMSVADPDKRQRIERLRAEGWRTIGLRRPQSGWKGEEYYERLCSKALEELHGN